MQRPSRRRRRRSNEEDMCAQRVRHEVANAHLG
jgi:hypothetical protein